jgi:hypothetical protein
MLSNLFVVGLNIKTSEKKTKKKQKRKKKEEPSKFIEDD